MAAVLSFAGTSFPPTAAMTSAGPRMSVAAAPPRTVAVPARSPGSLYEVLRVSSKATAGEIKAAYRTMAKRVHPDVAPASAEDFLEIRRAYDTLSDPAGRAQYDLSIGLGRRRGAVAAPAFAGGQRARYRTWETDQCW